MATDARIATETSRTEKVSMSKIDPMIVLQEARRAALDGRYSEALAQYRWFHEEALLHDPDVYGVRRSFALRYWKELGDVYPPARAELEATRDKKSEALRKGLVDREVFDDVSSLDELLDQIDHTCLLFKEIAETDEAFARKCFPSSRQALVKGKEFSIARRFIASPEGVVERLADRLNRSLRKTPAPTSSSSDVLRTAEVDNFIEDINQLLEILTGVGEMAQSETIRSMAVEAIEAPAAQIYVRGQLKVIRLN